jgi:hypothetical protein
MRSDMDKVIVEKPRHNSRAKSPNKKRKWQRTPPEEWPTREPIRMTDKGLSETLSPLKRFLEKSVGRPWDKVHSEMAAHVDRGNAVQAHVWQHIEQYLFLHVVIEDGKVYPHLHRHWIGEVSGLYVHPVTGIILRGKGPRRRWWDPWKRRPPVFKRIADNLFVGEIKGVWFEIRTANVASAPDGALDVVLKRPIAPEKKLRAYDKVGPRERLYGDASLYAVAKRPLNSKEIKARGLRPAARPLPNIVR